MSPQLETPESFTSGASIMRHSWLYILFPFGTVIILVFTCRVSLDNPFAWCGTLDDLFVVCPRNKSWPVGQAGSGLGARGLLPLPGHVSPPLQALWRKIQGQPEVASSSAEGGAVILVMELTLVMPTVQGMN